MCVLVLMSQLSLSNKMKIVRCFSDAAAASILEQRMFCAKFKLRYVYSACEQFKAKEKLLIALYIMTCIVGGFAALMGVFILYAPSEMHRNAHHRHMIDVLCDFDV